jgi:hypothetical protein
MFNLKKMVMKVNVNLLILFYLNTPSKCKDGLVPIYVRITIDGKKDEFSSGKKLNSEYIMVFIAQLGTTPLQYRVGHTCNR